ncbi:MAG TPA: hypothetical protein VGF56_08040 [Rhizomicrobium sp.]|jgi:hypothetical protein
MTPKERAVRLFLCLLVVLAGPASAEIEAGFDGYADLRLVAPGRETSWLKGGLGKLRYGAGDDAAQLAALFGQGYVRFTPNLTLVASLRVEQRQRTFADPIEAYLNYAPDGTEHWSWSLKTGAFFAPFSLENTELGWTSYWTLTPSAIDSWFGDELRTVGSEATVAWTGDRGTLTMMAAGLGLNQPAGVMMAERGWSMDDRPTGLFDRLATPDGDRTPIFKQFDGRIGWYAGVSWDDNSRWHIELIRYDNDANPRAHEDDYFAWHTRFWDSGASARFGDFAVLAQGLSGSTTIDDAAPLTTRFDSAYLLLGWERGAWRLGLRGDVFHTHTPGAVDESENGHAVTASVAWEPKDWFRLTGEVLSLSADRDGNRDETQFQLSARFYLQ